MRPLDTLMRQSWPMSLFYGFLRKYLSKIKTKQKLTQNEHKSCNTQIYVKIKSLSYIVNSKEFFSLLLLNNCMFLTCKQRTGRGLFGGSVNGGKLVAGSTSCCGCREALWTLNTARCQYRQNVMKHLSILLYTTKLIYRVTTCVAIPFKVFVFGTFVEMPLAVTRIVTKPTLVDITLAISGFSTSHTGATIPHGNQIWPKRNRLSIQLISVYWYWVFIV